MKNMRNSVQIIGNVGNAPEVRELQGGKMVARFSVATSENYKNSAGEMVKNTSWHQMVAWGSMANYIARNINKGNQIAVEGKLNSRSYEDTNGEKRYVTEIVVNEVLFTGTKTPKVLAEV